MMLLYRHPKNERTPPAQVGSTMMLYKTGVDLATQFALVFPKLTAIANCKFRIPNLNLPRLGFFTVSGVDGW